jgi:hypothetical protein
MKGFAVHSRRKYVGPSVVAANVKRSSRAPRRFDIDVCVQDAFLAFEGTSSDCPGRLDHDSVAIVDPFSRLEEPIAIGKVMRNVAPLERGGRANHPTSGFFGDVT